MPPFVFSFTRRIALVALCSPLVMSAEVRAADDHRSGFFGIFKKKKRNETPPQVEVRRALPVDNYVEVPDPLSVPYDHSTDKQWRPVVDGTIDSMNATIDSHFSNLERSGIGIMYGPKSKYASLTKEEQKAWIEANKKPGSLPPNPKRTSCIDFVLDQLRVGYERAGKLERFQEIKKIVVANEGQGTYLLKELEKDGWSMIYWNPDAKNPSTAIRTDSDKQLNHRPTHHKWTAATVKNQGLYMPGVTGLNGERFEGLRITDTVNDFRPTNPYATRRNDAGLEKLQNAPLFVGIANGGYHVYLGTKGRIVESHSTRSPKDPTNIEVRDFATWGLKGDEGFGSGVIAVPPGAWKKN